MIRCSQDDQEQCGARNGRARKSNSEHGSSLLLLRNEAAGPVPQPLRHLKARMGIMQTDMKRKILIVDDTRNVQVLLSDFLSGQDFEVLAASDGREALEVFHQEAPDLILLDIMMPNMDGYQFISHLRRESGVPVIMITARQQEADIIRGFDLGADDYITKPFRLRELLVRMRAVLRRVAPSPSSEPCLVIGDICLDTSRHEVKQSNHLIELTPLEFQVLEMLMRAPGQVVKRAELSMRLMENGYSGSEATLKIHIRNLRLKLNDDLEAPRYIETVFGIGYRFLEAAE